jgi:hypothetical protein
VAGNPRRNALFGIVSETCGLVETVGLELGTPPPSHRTSLRLTPGTGISDAETGEGKGDLSHAETKPEMRGVREKPHSGAISAGKPMGV